MKIFPAKTYTGSIAQSIRGQVDPQISNLKMKCPAKERFHLNCAVKIGISAAIKQVP